MTIISAPVRGRLGRFSKKIALCFCVPEGMTRLEFLRKHWRDGEYLDLVIQCTECDARFTVGGLGGFPLEDLRCECKNGWLVKWETVTEKSS